MIKLLTLFTAFSTFIIFSSCAEEGKFEKEDQAQKVAKLKDIEAIVKTEAGDIHLKLFASKTPVSVANFCNLAQRGFYQKSTFHRVVGGFVSQAGKHMSGAPGPGYTIKNETYTENPAIKNLTHGKAGMLAMARLPTKHTNGSQWYITHNATPNLDGDYTVFGEVTEGLKIATSLRRGTVIKDVEIKGETKELFEIYKPELTQWNKKLDEKFFLRSIGDEKKQAEKK